MRGGQKLCICDYVGQLSLGMECHPQEQFNDRLL